MSKGEEKFVNEDLPKIHAALSVAKSAATAGAPGQVIVSFGDGGGVISVVHESKKKFK